MARVIKAPGTEAGASGGRAQSWISLNLWGGREEAAKCSPVFKSSVHDLAGLEFQRKPNVGTVGILRHKEKPLPSSGFSVLY